jgi:uncharacterized membrane protein
VTARSGLVLPTRDDPTLRGASEVLGGPAGVRIAPVRRWWTPLRILLTLAALTMALGVFEREPCQAHAWSRSDGQQYAHACYSDIPQLYRERGFAEGDWPYLDSGNYQPLEYPVLTGFFMQVAAVITRPLAAAGIDARAVRFYDVNAVMLGIAGLVIVGATMLLAGRRPWDAAAVAASPLVALDGTINWDLFAVALTALGMVAWARRRPACAGMWLGLAVSAKLYPLVLLVPLACLCLRTRQTAAFGRTLGAAATAWAAVNVPIALLAPAAWQEFYTFNAQRGADFGSIWFTLDKAGHPVGDLNLVSGALTVAGLGVVGLLALRAPTRPRLASLAFLAVAVFVMTNKVWSPQYDLWLLPLAALARPRWRDLLIWQAGSAVYFVGVWLYLLSGYDRGLSQGGYDVLLLLRLVCLLWLVGVVIRDVLDPRRDPVRATGSDDPAGGVFDGAVERREVVAI